MLCLASALEQGLQSPETNTLFNSYLFDVGLQFGQITKGVVGNASIQNASAGSPFQDSSAEVVVSGWPVSEGGRPTLARSGREVSTSLQQLAASQLCQQRVQKHLPLVLHTLLLMPFAEALHGAKSPWETNNEIGKAVADPCWENWWPELRRHCRTWILNATDASPLWHLSEKLTAIYALGSVLQKYSGPFRWHK